MTEDWKKELADRMSDYSEPVSGDIFGDILASVERRRKQRKAFLYIVPAVAAAAVTVFAVLFDRGAEIPSEISRTAVAENLAVPAADEEAGTRTVAPDDNLAFVPKPEVRENVSEVPEPGYVRSISDSQKTEVQENIAIQNPEEQGNTPTVPGPETPGNTSDIPETEVRENVRENGETPVEVRPDPYDWQQILLADNVRRWEGRKSSLNVFASGFAGGTSSHAGYSPAVAAAAAEPMRYGENSLAGIMTLNRMREISTETRHFIPVRAGVAFAFGIAPGWSAGTGLTYTYLFSKSRTGSDSYYVDSRQTLHYLGIPLTVSYDIWSNHGIEVYVSAGGMLEKCVGGSAVSDYFYSNDVRSRESGKLRVVPLQWSLNASAGLQANLSPVVGIYVEPGISYYFDNGSDIPTVYSDRPLNFSLNLGLRFSLQ